MCVNFLHRLLSRGQLSSWLAISRRRKYRLLNVSSVHCLGTQAISWRGLHISLWQISLLLGLFHSSVSEWLKGCEMPPTKGSLLTSVDQKYPCTQEEYSWIENRRRQKTRSLEDSNILLVFLLAEGPTQPWRGSPKASAKPENNDCYICVVISSLRVTSGAFSFH